MTQVESTSLVLFGKTHDQTQVCLDQKLSSLLTTHVEASLTAPLLWRGAVSDPSPGVLARRLQGGIETVFSDQVPFLSCPGDTLFPSSVDG